MKIAIMHELFQTPPLKNDRIISRQPHRLFTYFAVFFRYGISFESISFIFLAGMPAMEIPFSKNGLFMTELAPFAMLSAISIFQIF